MCDRWLRSFENFLGDMGLKPPGMTLERRDVNGPYSPENCEWASPQAQTRNRRNTLRVTFRGETKLLIEWCDLLGLDYASAHRRIRREGRAPEEAFRLARSITDDVEDEVTA